MYLNKWVVFAACLVCQASAGLAYTFSLYSGALKEAFGYDQEQLQGIGSALNLGACLSIVAGLVYDGLRDWHRVGPRATLAAGYAINAGGYLLLWAAATHRFRAAYWQVALIAGLACNGGSWVDVTCLATGLRNFPADRGYVVGVTKSFLGLAASIYTTMYVAFFQPNAREFLLFLAFAPVATGVIGLLFIEHVPYVQTSELQSGQRGLTTAGRFLLAYQLVIALAVYQMTAAVVGQSSRAALGRDTRALLAAGTVVLVSMVGLLPWGTGGLLSRPAAGVAQDEEARSSVAASDSLPASPTAAAHRPGAALAPAAPTAPAAAQEDSSLRQPLLSQPEPGVPAGGAARLAWAPEGEEEKGAGSSGSGGARGHKAGSVVSLRGGAAAMPDLTPLQCLAAANFWLLAFSCCIGMGTGLMLLNNLEQLVEALGGAPGAQAAFVSLFSVCNCAGRLAAGYIPEAALHARGVPRPLFLVGVSALSAAVAAATAFVPLGALYACAAAAGLAFGAHWSLVPALASEVFGLKHFASNYSLLQMSPAVGSFALATKLAGWLYEREVARERAAGDACAGSHCFRLAFLVAAGLGCAATLSSLLLYRRTRAIYRLEFQEVHSYDEAVDDVQRLLQQCSGGRPAALRRDEQQS